MIIIESKRKKPATILKKYPDGILADVTSGAKDGLVKMGDTRHYYDIAVVGYGEKAYSGWQGELEGRKFVTPEELKAHPYTKIVTRKEIRTRKGVQIKEVEQVQWVSAHHWGNWTHYHEAFDYARQLLDDWMLEHHEKDCYPPTVIHITDGDFILDFIKKELDIYINLNNNR